MAQNALIQLRIDEELKKEADTLFADLGLDTPTAIRIFLRQSVKRQGLPFPVGQPMVNPETQAALEEAQQIASGQVATKGYGSARELFAELDMEDE